MERITEHVYAIEHQPEVDRPWIGYVKGDSQVLLIDAGNSPAHAQLIRKEIDNEELPRPDRLVLTHSHWDHSYGLAGWELEKGAVYAGEKTCELLKQMASWGWTMEEFEAHIAVNEIPLFCKEHMLLEYPGLAGIRVCVPDMVITKEQSIDLGGITCLCIPVNSPHTDDCVVYYIPEEKVLFVGDAYCEEVIGTDWIDRPAQRKAFAERIMGLDFARCVTGHSGILSREEFLNRWG